jgi:hypothetical protein
MPAGGVLADMRGLSGLWPKGSQLGQETAQKHRALLAAVAREQWRLDHPLPNWPAQTSVDADSTVEP